MCGLYKVDILRVSVCGFLLNGYALGTVTWSTAWVALYPKGRTCRELQGSALDALALTSHSSNACSFIASANLTEATVRGVTPPFHTIAETTLW